MKFTCDSCSAQYMISDEKVGPSGVKVRCKKCGNVIVVKRAADAVPAAAPAASSPAPGAGLDAELGSAFDVAFGDPPRDAAASGADLGDTQAMGSDDAAKVFAQGGANGATEWYVAIGQAQVGPLPVAEVKRKWEAGDVGPDSLVWRPGMGDWLPLTTVPELAGYLAPVPRPGSQSARASEPDRGSPGVESQQPSGEVSWKPSGASALAALASEEIATRSAPAPSVTARPAAGVKSLVDALPDGGGVDPTGALPLNLKALETATEEKKTERRSSVARSAEQARRRSTNRTVLVAAVVLLAAGGAAAYVLKPEVLGLGSKAPVAAAPAPAPAEAPPAVAAPAAPTPPAEAPPAVTPPAPQPAVAVAPPEPPAPAPAAPTPAPAAASSKPQATSTTPTRRETTRRETSRVATATKTEPAPAPAPRKKGGDLLDFESNDAALDDALGGGSSPSGRSVYVPPARASSLPDKVSTGDINAAVAQRIDPLRRCVSEQKAREPDASGTLRMRWIIQADGTPRDVKCITPQYAKGEFARCITGVLRTVQFPRSTTRGQEVTFPFNF